MFIIHASELHHDHDSHGEMPFDEKLLKLLNHWIKHNEDHAFNYRNWAEKAKANGQKENQNFSSTRHLASLPEAVLTPTRTSWTAARVTTP
mgnify:CR=1 FL=1